MKYLVDGPGARDFLELSQTDSGLRAMLGDPKAHDPSVGPEIVNAHIALREAAKKVAGLVEDPTRTDVTKHAAAKKLADAVTERLTKARAALAKRADELMNGAMAAADVAFGPKSDRAALHAEIRTWVRETLHRNSGDGIGVIRSAMKDNADVAAIIWHSPRFLLGSIPEELHDELRMEAVEAHKPDVYASLSNSVALSDLLGKYDNALRKVQFSFYNPEIAKQAAKRVEV
jgi:hypothetical protein